MSTYIARPTRTRNMIVLLGSTFLMVTTRAMWYRLLPLYLRKLGANDLDIGIAFSIALLLGPTQLLGGFISDRWGRRYSISIPTLILVPILIIGAQARHWLLLAATMWLVAFFGGIQQPGFQALIAESAADETRGRIFGGFYMTTATAWMVGPAIGALLIDVLQIRGLMWVNVGGALISGLLRLFFLREGQFTGMNLGDSTITLHDVFREPLYRRLIIINSIYMLIIWGLTRESQFIALHAADVLQIDNQAVNILYSIGGAGSILVSVIGGALADKVGSRYVTAGALLLHVVILQIWALLGGGGFGGYLIFGLSWISLQVVIVAYSTWSSTFAPIAVRGRVLGMIGAIGSIISAAGPQLGTILRSLALSRITGHGTTSLITVRAASASPFLLASILSVVFVWQFFNMPAHFKNPLDELPTNS